MNGPMRADRIEGCAGQLTMRFTETMPLDVCTDAVIVKWSYPRLARWPALHKWVCGQSDRWLHRFGGAESYFAKQLLTSKVVVVKQADVTEYICRLAEKQLKALGRRPQRVFMGMIQFEEIVHNAGPGLFAYPFSFEARFFGPRDIQRQSVSEFDRGGLTAFNVPVEVIPWMDGVLVI